MIYNDGYYIYISHHQYIQYISIYSILYQYLWSRATAGARPPQQFAWPPGHCSWRLEPWYLATRQATAWRGKNAARRRGPWGFSMGKMVVLVGFPPFNHEKCVFFFGRKIMGRVERSMTNHIFMQHSWYNQQYGSLIRFNRDNIEIIANNIHGFRQSPNQKGGFN